MAFFGITKLGYQNHIREHVRDPVLTPQHVFESCLYRDPKYMLPRLEHRSVVTLPPAGCADRTCRYGEGHGKSYWELMRLQQEFIVNPKGKRPTCSPRTVTVVRRRARSAVERFIRRFDIGLYIDVHLQSSLLAMQ